MKQLTAILLLIFTLTSLTVALKNGKYFLGNSGRNINLKFFVCFPVARCGLPPSDMGPCRASTFRYTYLAASNKCIQFVYGGCLGNLNKFRTQRECEEKCKEVDEVKEIDEIEPIYDVDNADSS